MSDVIGLELTLNAQSLYNHEKGHGGMISPPAKDKAEQTKK